MSKEHLTPAGWKPCAATVRPCKYPESREMGSASDASAFIADAVQEVQAGKPHAIRNFFNTLFGKAKEQPKLVPPVIEEKESSHALPQKSSPKLTVTAAPTVPSVSPAKPSQTPVGAVEMGVSGQWEVECGKSRSTEVLVHRFGDLITDQSVAERLHKADPLKDYQLGECGVIASELWNRNEHVEGYYAFRTEEDDEHMEGYGLHDFVRLHDGTYVDSMGLWSEEALLSTWREVETEGRIISLEDDAPVKKDRNVRIYNRELFTVLEELISAHMADK